MSLWPGRIRAINGEYLDIEPGIFTTDYLFKIVLVPSSLSARIYAGLYFGRGNIKFIIRAKKVDFSI